jgi:mannose-6-phosphate isomerase-like protein (cupin superfamily)
MKAVAGNLQLAYGELECCESGMKLQELDVQQHGFPFKSSRFTIDPGGSSPLDQHSVAEMWIVIEGTGELVYNGMAYDVKAGDAVYFEPFQTHLIHNHSQHVLKVLSFWWAKQCST